MCLSHIPKISSKNHYSIPSPPFLLSPSLPTPKDKVLPLLSLSCACPLPPSPLLYNFPTAFNFPHSTIQLILIQSKMIKLRSKRFSRSSSKLGQGSKAPPPEKDCRDISDIKWELRPGGMLVQKRDADQAAADGVITIRVSTVSHWHDISIQPTSTFGELKMILSLVTSLEPREQRLLFRGKERDDEEHLHMVGVRDKDKVLLLQDPAIKEKKLLALVGDQPRAAPCPTITV